MVLDEDVIMRDAGPLIDLSAVIESHQDDDVRSPRTPTYAPSSSLFANLQPFDPSALFSFGALSPKKPVRRKQHVPQTPAPPPPPPSTTSLAWIWQCHLCRSRWPLGATRRCLVDGHHYCSGEVDRPNLKKKKKGQSCSSEFDYVGWQEWGDWKRKALKSVPNSQRPKGCENCEFPSQCRYSKAADVVTTLSAVTAAKGAKAGKSALTTTDNDDLSRYYSSENTTSEAKPGDPLTPTNLTTLSEATDVKGAEVKKVKVSTSDKSKSKSNTRRASKKGGLSPIEEEIISGEIGAGLQDLVMPVVEFWHDKSLKTKTSA